MKFHEALAALDAVPPAIADVSPPVSGQSSLWLINHHGTTDQFSDPLAPENAGKAGILHPRFVDADLSQFVFDETSDPAYDGDFKVRLFEGGVFTPRVAVPGSLRNPFWSPTLNVYSLTFATELNGRFWGFNPHAYCRPSTTTTRPPCQCTQRYPDMRVTISGVGTQSQCSQTGVNGSCAPLNRTWCLYFRNSALYQCSWVSDWPTWWPCGVQQYLQLSLNWPAPYFASGSAAPGDCQSAELVIGGVIAYRSNSFDPNTGGTFSLVAGNAITASCTSLPSTLTVSVSSNCTTTTTTTTSTTSTSTTTTSTTTLPPVCGVCWWVWQPGSPGYWQQAQNDCTAGCACVSPATAGTTNFQIATTSCAAPPTTTTTSTTTTAAPACGQCWWSWQGSYWAMVLDGCSGACGCQEPTFNGTTKYEMTLTDCA